MTIMGIDPACGKEIAYAVWQFKKDVMTKTDQWKLICTGKTWDIEELAESIGKMDVVYIEDQFFSVNPHTLKRLAQVAGECIGVCKIVQSKYVMVAPSTWQSKLKFNYGRNTEKLSQYFWKKKKEEYLMKFASDLIGSPIDDPDVSAAMLIGFSGTIE